MIRKITFILLLTLSFASCSVGEDEDRQFVTGPIQDVTMPTSFKVDSTSHILVRYRRVSDCHIFNGFYLASEGLITTVAIGFVRIEQSDCLPDVDSEYEVPLSFKPSAPGTYTFRFYKGRDTDGTEVFLDTQAIVAQ